MTRSQVKVRVMEVFKLWKWPILTISKSIPSTSIHVIKRLMVNYDTPWQYLNFTGQILIFALVWHHVTFKLRVLQLLQSHFVSSEEWTSSPLILLKLMFTFYIFHLVVDENMSSVMYMCGFVNHFRVSPKTLLTFCTNGVLLRTLMTGDQSLSTVTHVIVVSSRSTTHSRLL